MELTIILSIIAALLSLITWFTQRKWVPTKAEQLTDLSAEYEDTTENVHRLRAQGKHAEAEAMLARMRARATAERLRNDKQSP